MALMKNEVYVFFSPFFLVMLQKWKHFQIRYLYTFLKYKAVIGLLFYV